MSKLLAHNAAMYMPQLRAHTQGTIIAAGATDRPFTAQAWDDWCIPAYSAGAVRPGVADTPVLYAQKQSARRLIKAHAAAAGDVSGTTGMHISAGTARVQSSAHIRKPAGVLKRPSASSRNTDNA